MENLHLPIDYLMPEIKSLILSIEEKMNCPRDFATTAVFAIASGAIGNRIQTNDGVYKNRLNINVCHVAPPGSNKTAPVSLLLKPLVAIHDEIMMQSRMERKNFEASKGSDEKPLPKILFASNPTPEAINKFLAYNPRGIFVRRDELKGFIEDLSGRYNSGDGGVSDFLSTFTNESISIIRSGEEPLSIPQPYLSVMGGIQPSILKDVLGKKLLMGNGFNYRWLFVYPDIEVCLTRQHEGVDKKALEYWHTFVKCLWNIAPMEFTFSDAAQKLLDEYYRKIAEKKIEEKDCDTYMSEVRDKLFVYSQKWAGLANILHGDCVPFGLNRQDNRFVDGKPCETIISREAMKYAIDCMEVFEHWAERVHNKIEENDTTKITLADAIRVVNDFYPISNKSQFAQSCGMTRELLYKYLPKGKDTTPSK